MMSGTSADGIDLAAVSIDDDTSRPRVRFLATAHRDYPAELRDRVLRAASHDAATAADLAILHAALGDAYADAARAFISALDGRPDVIAVHGQTVAHLPDRHATLQLGDASRVALRTGVATVWAGSPEGYDELGVSAVAVPPSLGGGVLAAGLCYYVDSPAKGRTAAVIRRWWPTSRVISSTSGLT